MNKDGTFSSEFDAIFSVIKDQGKWYIEHGDLVLATQEKGEERIIRHPIMRLEKERLIRYHSSYENGQIFQKR